MNNHVTGASVGHVEANATRQPLSVGAAESRYVTAATETAVTPDAILALYKWGIGSCFRCGDAGVFVTPIDAILTVRGERYDLSACGGCVLAMEGERRRHAERRGLRYEPGRLGRDPS